MKTEVERTTRFVMRWAGLGVLAALVGVAAGCARPIGAEPVTDAKAAMEIRQALVAKAAPTEGGAEEGQTAAQATGWATLKGRFLYEGKPPAAARIDIAGKDPEVCGKHPLYSENLMTSSDGGLANVVLWARNKNLPVHADYEKSAGDKALLDNHDCQFVPHVLAMRNTQTLEIKNSDASGHNTNAGGLTANAPFNVVIPANSAADQKLAVAENMPATVTCNIHPWMKGYLLVRPDPYYAVTAKDGTFEIKNVPAGLPLEFQAWHEAASGGSKAVQADRADLKWQGNGRFTVTLEPEQVMDLKEIKVPAGALAAQ